MPNAVKKGLAENRAVLAENVGTLAEIGREFDVPDRKLWRWITLGIGGRTLEAVQIGHNWLTSREALRRFLDATSAAGAA